MAGLIARFAAALASSGLTNERVLVAVSGGIDSTTLLSIVCSLREQQQLDVHVAHVDHGLRDESSEDAAFVRLLADRYDVPFHTGRVDVHSHALEMGCGIEAAARKLRYDFLTSVALRIGATTVLTGHTADDQIETVLMNVARGGNTAALAGIPRERNLTEGVRVLRPLLDIHRTDVENFAREHELEWVEDASNSEVVHLRNRVRHELLPHLRSVLGPGIGEHILRMSQSIKQLHEMVEQLADAAEGSLLMIANGRFEIDLEHLATTPRVVSDAIFGRHIHLTRADRDRLHGLATAEVGSKATLSGGRLALRERRFIIVFGQELTGPELAEFEIRLDNPLREVSYPIGHRTLTVHLTDSVDKSSCFREDDTILVDESLVVGVLRCRPWQSGDRIHLEGMSGSKLVSDVLTDAKIPHAERRNIRVIADDEGILWICGLRQSRRAAITDSTVRCLLCRIEPGISSD